MIAKRFAMAAAISTTLMASLAVAASSSFALDSGTEATATGSAVTRPDDFGIRRVFTFSAIRQQDGSVSGHGYIRRDDNGFDAHFTIDCLRVDTSFDGLPTATLGGMNTSSSNPNFEGKRLWFRAVDAGPGALVDSMTLHLTFVATPPVSCTEEPPFDVPVFPIQDGNVVIH